MTTSKVSELIVYPINQNQTVAAYRVMIKKGDKAPLISRPGRYGGEELKKLSAFDSGRINSFNPVLSIDVIAKGPNFYLHQGAFNALVHMENSEDQSGVIAGNTPSVYSTFDSSEKVIEKFQNWGILGGCKEKPKIFPQGLYTRLVIEGPDLNSSLWSNFSGKLSPDATAVMISYAMTGDLFRIYQLISGGRSRLEIKFPFKWEELKVMGGEAAEIPPSFLPPETKEEWEKHIKGINSFLIENTGEKREGLLEALRLFCLEENDPCLDKKLRETYHKLVLLFRVDGISEPLIQKAHTAIMSLIHPAYSIVKKTIK